VKVACDPDAMHCTVHTLFDFTAAHPAHERRTYGVGALQLVVSFADGQPRITVENSKVLRQARNRRSLAFEDRSYD
jgi:hypothetical protein